MDKQTTYLHTNRSQHCHSSQICKHTTHTQIQQFSISTFKTSEKHFIKRHYIPQQIFHHLLIYQSKKFAKHFSSYKILMLNFFSLPLSPPLSLSFLSHCLSVCLSVCLSLLLSHCFYRHLPPLFHRVFLGHFFLQLCEKFHFTADHFPWLSSL